MPHSTVAEEKAKSDRWITEKGFSIAQLLAIQQCYYFIGEPYQPEYFVK